MTNKEIIENIKSHLTKEKEIDVAYLQTEMAIYRNLQNEEVIYAIANMLFEYLDPAIKEKLDLKTHAILDERRAEYETVVNLLNEGKVEEAKMILLKLIEIFEKATYTNEKNYYDFDQMAEYFIFCESVQKGRSLKVKRYPEPVTYYMYQLAMIYQQENNIEMAIDALKKGLKYNPRCIYIMQELCLIYKQENLFNQLYQMLNSILKYAYTKDQLAFCYYELGLYFKNEGKYDIACACFMNSNYYEKNDRNNQEIEGIVKVTNQKYFNNTNDIFACFIKHNIQNGVSNLVINALQDFLIYSKRINDLETVGYIAMVMYELTNNEKYLKEIEGN